LTFIDIFEERSFEFIKAHSNADKNVNQIEKYKNNKNNFKFPANI
jgi:hypothetical protein